MRLLLAATKAFAEPTRVRVIFALRAEELCVCELCDALGLVQSTLSTHLQYLRQADLVHTRQDGKWVYYRLTDDFARVAGALFKLYHAELATDAQLRADSSRLQERLALRAEDSCCLGSAPRKPAKERQRARVKV